MARQAFVFVSQPTTLTDVQAHARDAVVAELDRVGLVPRTVGTTDFAARNPLLEVCILAKHCSGGVVLGFRQTYAPELVVKPGTAAEHTTQGVVAASAWNQLESGVLTAMRVPLLVFREPGVTGGIFDPGSGDHFVNELDAALVDQTAQAETLRQTIQSWSEQVWNHYRSVW